jgi:dinuclear metal center YbgI/SA1388 family protein
MLDNRLKKCAEKVSGKGVAVDVGTDHALLAAELVLSGKCERVIASDVKEGPLESARKTVEKYGIVDKVQLVLSDGLENVPLDGVTDVVIAGMGGETIADIIGNIPEGSLLMHSPRWILQPMTKPEYLRKKLFELNMTITGESVVEDGERLYVVICAEQSFEHRRLTEFESICGFFDEDDELARKYRERESERLSRIADSLASAGKTGESTHYAALSFKLKNDCDSVNIGDVYSCLDELYPFAAQESWDNSGLLVENSSNRAETVLLSLDISTMVVEEAAEKLADLVISHHPVIFDPLRRVAAGSPVFGLVQNDIAAICAHTNLDIAAGGTNGVILRKISERIGINGDPEPFEEVGGGRTLGWIVRLKEVVPAETLALMLKEIFGCERVRMTQNRGKLVSRVAFCSGSGGSSLDIAVEKGCDAYVTADVKHDVWISANNCGIALLDCGHFDTENPVLWELRRVLEERFPQLDVEIAESSADPCEYV